MQETRIIQAVLFLNPDQEHYLTELRSTVTCTQQNINASTAVVLTLSQPQTNKIQQIITY